MYLGTNRNISIAAKLWIPYQNLALQIFRKCCEIFLLRKACLDLKFNPIQAASSMRQRCQNSYHCIHSYLSAKKLVKIWMQGGHEAVTTFIFRTEIPFEFVAEEFAPEYELLSPFAIL